MEKTFNHHEIERKCYESWEAKGYFAPSGDGVPYCIMIPPPNVTGSLHMGHAFQDSIMDALVRYQRMKGSKTLWQVGTDHAGIATQMIVERKLQTEEGKSRHDYGRDSFIEKVWQWKEYYGDRITRQLRSLGASVDWDSERFTMDEGFYEAVLEVFVSLYEEDLIYRGKRLVNWDPKLHTAISDLEVENKEINGHMWYLRYPLADAVKTYDGKDFILVATTRPETMLGDTGVAVNPNDERYFDLIGKDVILPLVNRRIPIVADEHADMNKGTGCVKITPAHDFNDYEVGRRCGLSMINIMTLNGDILKYGEAYNMDGACNAKIDAKIPKVYQGMERFSARKQIVQDLNELGLIDRIEDHKLMIPYGDRSGVIIEPLLTDQWFVRAAPLAKPAVDAVADGRIQFVPKQYENMYFAWMKNIQDWCISRQLWWGHRIPAWYDQQGNVYVGRSEDEVRAKYSITKEISLKQDDDVLDTWFSSALWTFGTLGWPAKTERLKAFHPTDILVTGFDIIFFWVARMIMMTMHFIKDEEDHSQVPFKYVYVTGLIRDENGDKMSKSKGNVLDPLDMINGIDLESLVTKRCDNMLQPQLSEKIEKHTRKAYPTGIAAHGTDALRYTLYSLASTGRDINWDMNRLEGYRHFCNKIWNAACYVKMHTDNKSCGIKGEQLEFSVADRWIISELQRVIEKIEKNLSDLRLDHASQNLYDFIWNEYCAWYLELSKPVLWDDSGGDPELDGILSKNKRGARYTLVTVLECLMRLAHPFMPYITEEIWQNIKGSVGLTGETIMVESYPVADQSKIDEQAEQDVRWIKDFITSIRNIRADLKIGAGQLLEVLCRNMSIVDERRLSENDNFLKSLAKLSRISVITIEEQAPLASTQLVGSMEILVPIAGLIDKDKEIARLNKEINRLTLEANRFANKLNNDKFVGNAPTSVVAKEKKKLAQIQDSMAKLEEQLIAINAL